MAESVGAPSLQCNGDYDGMNEMETPAENGDFMEEQICGEKEEKENGELCGGCGDTREELAEVKRGLSYLTHQVYRILLALHVPACTCADCAAQHAAQNELVLQTSASTPSNGHSTSPPEPVDNVSMEDGVTEGEGDGAAEAAASGLTNETLSLLFQSECASALTSASSANRTGRAALLADLFRRRRGGGGSSAGRRPKYCDPEQQKTVAEYASKYGASSAARHFNIPSTAVSYYFRKTYGRTMPRGRRPLHSRSPPPLLARAAQPPPADPGGGGGDQSESTPPPLAQAADTPGDLWDALESVSDQYRHPSPLEEQPSAAAAAAAAANGEARAVGLLNGGSPRGRGRPKLIGDELDQELLEHLVELRLQSGRRLSVDQVHSISSEFVRDRRPGMLVQDGGVVELKLTWATKLHARVNEQLRLRCGYR